MPYIKSPKKFIYFTTHPLQAAKNSLIPFKQLLSTIFSLVFYNLLFNQQNQLIILMGKLIQQNFFTGFSHRAKHKFWQVASMS